MNKSRQTIFDKSGGYCWYCGCMLGKGWHADHFYPVVRVGGKMLYPELDSLDNKVPSCPQCNMMKSSMNIESFRNTVQQFVESLNLYTTQYKFAKKYNLVKETGINVKFWFEENKKHVKPEHELLKISERAIIMEWKKDKEERDYYYVNFDDFICTLRRVGNNWIAIAMSFSWEELGRIEIQFGRLEKEKAADWAIKIQEGLNSTNQIS